MVAEENAYVVAKMMTPEKVPAPGSAPDKAMNSFNPEHSFVGGPPAEKRFPSRFKNDRARAYYQFMMGGMMDDTRSMSYSMNPGQAPAQAPDMELREIVEETIEVLKKLKRKLVPFLCAFYIPVVFIYLLYMWGFAYLDHYDMVEGGLDYIIALSQNRPGGTVTYYQPSKYQFETVSYIRLLVKFTFFSTYIVCYYLAITSTIILIFSNHETEEKDQWSVKRIFKMLPDRFWRVAATDFLKMLILGGIIVLGMFLLIMLLWTTRIFNAGVVAGFVILEPFLFIVWIFTFLLKVNLTSQIAAVERVWGNAAIQSSETLLKGKKMTILVLLIFQVVCSYLVYIGQATLMLCPSWTKYIGFFLNVALVVAWYLFLTTMTTVYYLSCKTKPNERGISLPSFAFPSDDSFSASFVAKPQAQYKRLPPVAE